MAVQTRSVLKTYFETGDKPTAAQFGDLIDSVFAANHVINHSVSTITAVSGTVYSTAITSTLIVLIAMHLKTANHLLLIVAQLLQQ